MNHVASLIVALFVTSACSGAGPSSSDDVDDRDAASGVADLRVVLEDVELAPGSTHQLELGSTRVGGFVPRYEVILENTGTAAVTLDVVAAEGFAGIVEPVLEPGASTTLSLGLVPASPGAKAGMIELRTSVPGKELFTFDLTGTVLSSGETPLNPYWTTTAWKLWFEDETPVTYTGLDDPDGDGEGTTITQDFAPPAAGTRQFPTATALAATWPGVFTTKEVPTVTPASAGWWDDAAGTMDRGHSRPRTSFAGILGNSLNLSDQFIRVPYGNPGSTQRLALGLNFTSESYAQRGHQLTRAQNRVADTERTWMFVNAVRGSPSFHSYNDSDPTHVADSYDGLYGTQFQSFGRSGSETAGMFKMLVAGGYMPRTTKELIKRHGAYAPTVLTLFRQALPYVHADGTPVAYENELLHRPTYLSDGESTGPMAEFAPYNMTYHQYPNTLHLYRMVQGAKALTTAPPVAIMKLLGVSSSAGAWPANDPRVKVRARTMTTVWADPGEAITLRVDLGESIDLEGGALDFSAHAVYPNQASALQIVREGKTAIFRITATPDPALPLGRFPILLQAHVRGLRSNPMFVNVYWRQADQLVLPENKYFHPTASGFYHVNDPRMAVFWNARPELATSLGATTSVTGSVGVPVTFSVTCTDPEGFPTTLYRRADDPGVISGDTYAMTPSASGTSKVALICSDGTGAYNSTTITVTVP